MVNFFKDRISCPIKIVLWLLICICLSLASLASAEVLRQAVSSIECVDQTKLHKVVLLAVFITMWSIIFEYLKRTMEKRLINQSETKLQIFLLEHMLHIDKVNFIQKRSGETLTLLQDNIEKAVNGSFVVLMNAVNGVGVLIITSVYMCSLSWQLMLIVIVCNIIFRVFTRFFDQKIRLFSKRTIALVNESNSFFMEVLRNELLVRIYRRKKYIEEVFKEKETTVARSGRAVYGIRNGYDEITWFISMLITIVFIYGIGGIFMLRGMFEFSVLMAFTKASANIDVANRNAILNVLNRSARIEPFF